MTETRPADVAEIRRVYARRRENVDPTRYSLLNAGNLRNVQERERLVAAALRHAGVRSMSSLEILEVGCGTGGELGRFVAMGAKPGNLYGVDLLPESIQVAKERLPGANLSVGNAAGLEFPDGRFDLVVQHTALSSMKSAGMRTAVAREMVRVARPGGLVLSYDFIRNPLNPDTVGISRRDLRSLFPGLRLTVHRVTLVPPLARRLPARLADVLAAVPLLRTHLLAIAVVPGRVAAPGDTVPGS